MDNWLLNEIIVIISTVNTCDIAINGGLAKLGLTFVAIMPVLTGAKTLAQSTKIGNIIVESRLNSVSLLGTNRAK